MFDITLDSSDAGELAEILQLLADWLTTDPDTVNTCLTRYVGTPAYNAGQLRADLTAPCPSWAATISNCSTNTPAESHHWRVTK